KAAGGAAVVMRWTDLERTGNCSPGGGGFLRLPETSLWREDVWASVFLSLRVAAADQCTTFYCLRMYRLFAVHLILLAASKPAIRVDVHSWCSCGVERANADSN